MPSVDDVGNRVELKAFEELVVYSWGIGNE